MRIFKSERILLSTLLLVGLAGCMFQPLQPEMNIIPSATQSSKNIVSADELAVFKKNLIEEYQPVLKDMQHATRYQIDLQITDTVADVSGHEQVLYTNNEDVPLKEVYFRLFPNISGLILTVTNLTVNGTELPAILTNQDTALRVDLPAPLPPGDQTLIAMDFQQKVPREMGGNYGLNIYMDGILALDQFFPIIPVYDENGWEVQDPPINADMLFADEAFFRVRVNAPADLVLAGSGIEVGSVDGDQRKEVIFIGGPQRDFFLAASLRFESVSRKVGGTTVTAYFPGEYRQAGNLVLETAEHALASYNQRFGNYPYTELDLISTPMNAGGMEYSTATSLSLGYFDFSAEAGYQTFLEAVVAHEVAHQWFFNQVMNNQITEPWLDESLAQYVTYLYYLDRYGQSGAAQYERSWDDRWENLDGKTIPIGKSAGDYSRDAYGPIIYGRGPLFVAALDEKMGDEAFNRFLKIYFDQYRWRIADGKEFENLAEETCDCTLDALFRKWGVE